VCRLQNSPGVRRHFLAGTFPNALLFVCRFAGQYGIIMGWAWEMLRRDEASHAGGNGNDGVPRHRRKSLRRKGRAILVGFARALWCHALPHSRGGGHKRDACATTSLFPRSPWECLFGRSASWPTAENIKAHDILFETMRRNSLPRSDLTLLSRDVRAPARGPQRGLRFTFDFRRPMSDGWPRAPRALFAASLPFIGLV
jgi:hypothetical protein